MLFEIRSADLRFSPTEIQRLFQTQLGVELSSNNLDILVRRTEGWIASLQLALLALEAQNVAQNPVQVDRFIQQFDGSHHYVVDYLMGEVLAHVSDEVAAFLTRTAYLPRFCAALCNAVLDQDHSGPILAYLQDTNLFLVRLDQEHNWFRYHHLFAEVAQKHAVQNDIDAVAIRSRASVWFEQNGYLIDAIEMVLAAEDVTHAARLIEQATHTNTWGDGNWSLFVRWVKGLPEAFLAKNPQLYAIYVWSLLAISDTRTGLIQLQKLDRLLDSQPDIPDAVWGLVAGIKGLIARISGNVEGMRHLGQQVRARRPDTDSFWQISGLINLGAAAFLEDEVEQSARWFQQAHDLAAAHDFPHWQIVILAHLAELKVRYGELHAAERYYRQAQDISEDEIPIVTSSGGAAYTGVGALWYEWNDLPRAVLLLQRGQEMGDNAQNGLISFSSRVGLAKVYAAQNQLSQVERLCQELDHYLNLPAFNWTWQHLPRETAVAHLWMGLDEWSAAERILRPALEKLDPTVPYYWHEQIQIAHARLLLGRGDVDATLAILDPLVTRAEDKRRVSSQLDIGILRIQACARLDDVRAAQSILRDMLVIAAPASYIRRFVDAGEPIVDLLPTLPGTSAYQNYIEQILAAFPPGAPTQTPRASALIEPLTSREQELIQLVATGISNREIAEHLTISYATVRRHLNNIYGKLTVNSRAQAILRAREWQKLRV